MKSIAKQMKQTNRDNWIRRKLTGFYSIFFYRIFAWNILWLNSLSKLRNFVMLFKCKMSQYQIHCWNYLFRGIYWRPFAYNFCQLWYKYRVWLAAKLRECVQYVVMWFNYSEIHWKIHKYEEHAVPYTNHETTAPTRISLMVISILIFSNFIFGRNGTVFFYRSHHIEFNSTQLLQSFKYGEFNFDFVNSIFGSITIKRNFENIFFFTLRLIRSCFFLPPTQTNLIFNVIKLKRAEKPLQRFTQKLTIKSNVLLSDDTYGISRRKGTFFYHHFVEYTFTQSKRIRIEFSFSDHIDSRNKPKSAQFASNELICGVNVPLCCCWHLRKKVYPMHNTILLESFKLNVGNHIASKQQYSHMLNNQKSFGELKFYWKYLIVLCGNFPFFALLCLLCIFCFCGTFYIFSPPNRIGWNEQRQNYR